MSVVYIPINFIGTKVKGKPIYDILNWEDWSTAWYLIGIIALLLVSFHSFTFISTLRRKKEEFGSIIVNKNAEGSTSLLWNSMEMSV